jgi:putative ABC transport system substrate-binding protein
MLRNLLIILTLFFSTFLQSSAEDKVLITINQFVNHPALDAVTKGVEQSLKDRGIMPDKAEIRIDNAQGSITNAVQIAKHQVSLNPTVMVAVATPSAQADLKVKKDNILLAFGAVTDPAAAGLTNSLNVIGVNDQPPITELISYTRKILPKVKTIGVLFNPGEINSVKMTEKLEEIALSNGLNIEKVGVNSSSNIKLAVQQLIPKVNLIYLPQDNLVVSAIDSVIQLTLKAKIPVIANDPSLVAQGVVFALGSDYFQDGIKLGNMIADHLNGIAIEKNITSSGVRAFKFNEKSALSLGVVIPSEFKLKGSSYE